MYRYHRGVPVLPGSEAAGLAGPKIFSIHGEIGKVIGPARRPWLAEHYGGAMMLLGCHLLDLAVALMGAPRSPHCPPPQHVSGAGQLSRP
jgi:predicted dehydrogenase